MHHRTLVMASLLVLAVPLAGCIDDGGDGETEVGQTGPEDDKVEGLGRPPETTSGGRSPEVEAVGVYGTIAFFDEDGGNISTGHGAIWVGPWNLDSGWRGPAERLEAMRSDGTVPVIQFYYWGDDMSPECLAEGCWSDLHDTWKDQAGWERVAEGLVRLLDDTMEGDEVVVVVETEFNKHEVAYHEPLDRLLAEKVAVIEEGYPAAKTVMGLGNWNRAAWPTFDRTAEAVDYVGLQAIRGSTRDDLDRYLGLYDATLAGARDARLLFNRPIILHDIALSSYPEPEYLHHQADALARFFDGLTELQDAGVAGLVYRAWYDDPDRPPDHYGPAERHWGLAYPETKEWKPAASVWVEGVREATAQAT